MGQFNTIPPNPFPPSSENAGGGTPYTLPPATSETLGGVIVGSGLSINESGVLSAPPSGDTYSTDEQVVGTWLDGSSVYEKTVQVTMHGTEDYDTLVVSDVSPSFAWIVNSDFVSVQGSDKLHFYLGSRVSGVMTTGFLISKSNGLYLRTNNNYAGIDGLSGYVTIRYVKPTV